MHTEYKSQIESGGKWERWIALLAFTVAALVRAGLFKRLPW